MRLMEEAGSGRIQEVGIGDVPTAAADVPPSHVESKELLEQRGLVFRISGSRVALLMNQRADRLRAELRQSRAPAYLEQELYALVLALDLVRPNVTYLLTLKELASIAGP